MLTLINLYCRRAVNFIDILQFDMFIGCGYFYLLGVVIFIYWVWLFLFIGCGYFYLLGVVIFLYSFTYFASIHTRIHFLLIPHSSTVTLSLLPLHITITQNQTTPSVCPLPIYAIRHIHYRATVGWTAECELWSGTELTVELR